MYICHPHRVIFYSARPEWYHCCRHAVTFPFSPVSFLTWGGSVFDFLISFTTCLVNPSSRISLQMQHHAVVLHQGYRDKVDPKGKQSDKKQKQLASSPPLPFYTLCEATNTGTSTSPTGGVVCSSHYLTLFRNIRESPWLHNWAHSSPKIN